MNYRVLIAPEPPQYTAELSIGQLARLDPRFGHLEELERREILGAVVQESADLQASHIVLQTPSGDVKGVPGSVAEQNDADINQLACPALCEEQFAWSLALDLLPQPAHTIPACEFEAEVSRWNGGVLYGFCWSNPSRGLVVTRRLNLARFVDRMEREFLLAYASAEVRVLRAHRLEHGGVYRVLRTVY